MRARAVDVVIIGSGPAGLATATRLRRLGVERVVVLERESAPGGIPRHCGHPSFGLREFGRPLTGPRYVSALLARARSESVVILAETTALELSGGGQPSVVTTSPDGVDRWEADAVVLASGCRERPRSARLIPGTRPPGVITTAELQQFTYLSGEKIGEQAVVVGAEHVSFSAVMTLRDAGIQCAAMVTPFTSHQTYPPLHLWATRLGRVPLLTDHRLLAIEGRGRVDGVIVGGPDGSRRIECDTVIVTADWVAEGSLALRAGMGADARNGGRPEALADGSTSLPGIFAAGSVLSPGESASSATNSGRTAADTVAAHLGRSRVTAPRPELMMEWDSPIRWISPNRTIPGEPVTLRMRVDQWVTDSSVAFRVNGALLDTVKVRRMVPGKTYRFDGSWMKRLDGEGARVRVSIGVSR